MIVTHCAVYVCQTTSTWDGLPTYEDVMDSEKTVVIFDEPDVDESQNWETMTSPPDMPPTCRGSNPPSQDTLENVQAVNKSSRNRESLKDSSKKTPKASALRKDRGSMNSSVTVGGAQARCVSGVWYFDL